ncbi:MAG: hypothetical protein V1874_17000 [Spirochaetota bacterium]
MKVLTVIIVIILAVAAVFGVRYVLKLQETNRIADCEEKFARIDINKDLKVSLEEFKSEKQLAGNDVGYFNSKDSNKDGFLSKEELCSKDE